MKRSKEQNEVYDDVQQFYDRLRLQLALRITILLNIVFFILTIVYSRIDSFTLAAQLSAFVMTLVCLFILLYKKNFKLVFFIYSVVGIILCTLSLLLHHHTLHYVEILWLFACTTVAYFTFGKRIGLIFLCIISLVTLYFVFFTLNENISQLQQMTFLEKIPFAVESILAFFVNIYLFHLFTTSNDYANKKLRELNNKLKSKNKEITNQNAEKTILVREIHHRVKNNLQIIVSLLRMQSSKITDVSSQQVLQESINRIMSMALIHQKLYQNNSLSNIVVSDYVKELTETILNTSTNSRKEVEITIYSEVESISLEHLVPLGLIINELTSNSLKHAFEKCAHPAIDIRINSLESNNFIELVYKDNGQWKPRKKSHDSFGISLIEGLSEQLDGSLTIEKSNSGTTFIVLLKQSLKPNVLT